MRFNFIAGLGRMMASVISQGAMLAHVAGSKTLREDFTRTLVPEVSPFAMPQGKKSRNRVGWGGRRKTTWFLPHGDREKARRVRQGAHQRQINSHKPGTVQPRHIFGDAA